MTALRMRCTMVSVVVLRGTRAATEMLLLRRASAYLRGEWSYVAGHIEADEHAWQTALRELKEETALVPRQLFATSFCEQFYNAQDDLIEVVPAFVAQVDETAVVHLNREHDASAWLALARARQRVPFGSQRQLLTYVQQEFIERLPSPHLRIALPA